MGPKLTAGLREMLDATFGGHTADPDRPVRPSRVTPELVSNVVGVVGLVLVVVAVGGLLGVWPAVLLAGLLMVGVAFVVARNAATAAVRAPATAKRPDLKAAA